MKKLALLNIKEATENQPELAKKDTAEIKFKEKHPELYLNEKEEQEEVQEEPSEVTEESKDKDYWQVMEAYTVNEPKIWDCYQLFCKLINYKYNPYDDKELEDYLEMQELQEQENLEMGKKAGDVGGSMWPFSK